MKILNRLTLKNLLLNKKRTIVTIIGVILSTALITAVITMYTSLVGSVINYETFMYGNFHYGFTDVEKSDVENYSKARNVKDVYYSRNVGYAKLDSSNDYKPYAFIMETDSNSIRNLSVRVVEGRIPEKEGEILVPTHLDTNGRVEFSIGDTITLDVCKRVSEGEILNQNTGFLGESEELADCTKKTYNIVGITERLSRKIEPYQAPGYTFVTINENVKESDVLNIYLKLSARGLENHAATIADVTGIDEEIIHGLLNGEGNVSPFELIKYKDKIEKFENSLVINDYLILLESDKVGNEVFPVSLIIIVCGIIIVASVYCIKNSFDISLSEKTRQFGMLKSIGATKKQIRISVLYEALYIGIIGIPLGILCGIFASYILTFVCNYYLKDLLAMGFNMVLKTNIYGVLFSCILGAVTILLSAIRSARKAAKVSPIDSIRYTNDIKIKSKKLKGSKLVDKLFGIGGDISYKNLKRNRRKYRTTVISIIVSVSVFIALSSFVNLAFDVVSFDLKMSDYNIKLNVYDVDNKDLLAIYRVLTDHKEYLEKEKEKLKGII